MPDTTIPPIIEFDKTEQTVVIDIKEYIGNMTPEQASEAREAIVSRITDILSGKESNIRDVLANASHKSLTELMFFNLITKKEKRSVSELFNGILNGRIKEIQSFNEKGVGRRVFIKPSVKDDIEYHQPYVRNKDGREEEWNITIDNLNKGTWIEIPGEDERVGYGIAHEALLTGACTHIRCEDWPDQTSWLKRKVVITDDGHHHVLVKADVGSYVSLSSVSMASRNWIMVSVPNKKVK